ncbi:MAG: hypothetical protein ACI9R3_001570 [Verrucomicrobiales bacterium]
MNVKYLTAVILVFIVIAQTVQAETFTVMSASDAGDGAGNLTTLREAHSSANGSPGADLIVFAPGVTGTMALQRQFTITDDVEIIGPGAEVLILDAGDALETHSVFEVRSNDAANISGFTLSRARRPAIVNNGILTVSDCVVEDGDTVESNWGVAGIRNRGSVTALRCQFLNNLSRSKGGAIFNEEGSTATIRDSMFEGNRGSGDGGAIFNEGTLEVSGSEFAINGGNNGSIYNAEEATLVIAEGCVFRDHTSTPIRNLGIAEIEGATFHSNTVRFGSGAISNSREGSLRIVDSVIRDNQGTGDNGAIFNEFKAELLTVERCSFLRNSLTPGGAGAAIASQGLFSVTDSLFEENSAGIEGGALAIRGKGGHLERCTFSGNHASSGGAIFNRSPLEIVNCTFSGNTASGEFGCYH